MEADSPMFWITPLIMRVKVSHTFSLYICLTLKAGVTPQRWPLTCPRRPHKQTHLNSACTSQTLEDVSIYLFWTVRAGITHPASRSVCDYTSEKQNARWLISVFESPDLKRWTNVWTKTCFRVRWRIPAFDRFTGSDEAVWMQNQPAASFQICTHRYECVYISFCLSDISLSKKQAPPKNLQNTFRRRVHNSRLYERSFKWLLPAGECHEMIQ